MGFQLPDLRGGLNPEQGAHLLCWVSERALGASCFQERSRLLSLQFML